MFRTLMLASSVYFLSGCALLSAQQETSVTPTINKAAWKSGQQQKLTNVLHGTGYILSETEDGWLIKIAEKGTFNPKRPEMLLPGALGNLSKVTRHLADDGEVAVFIVGVAGNDNYALKPAAQISRERAGSVSSIFRMNKVAGHRVRSHSVSDHPELDKSLGLVLMVVHEHDLQRKDGHYQSNAVALLKR